MGFLTGLPWYAYIVMSLVLGYGLYRIWKLQWKAGQESMIENAGLKQQNKSNIESFTSEKAIDKKVEESTKGKTGKPEVSEWEK